MSDVLPPCPWCGNEPRDPEDIQWNYPGGDRADTTCGSCDMRILVERYATHSVEYEVSTR